jgi:AbrB family looped-hinge helix DNA binding protein
MSRVTSKLQVTVPKAIAEQYRIRPGDEIEWVPAGDSIRVLTAGAARPGLDLRSRLESFDQATARQGVRGGRKGRKPSRDRGWTREDLYAERLRRRGAGGGPR